MEDKELQEKYTRLKQLVSLKRKEVAEESFEKFVDIYLGDLASVKRPTFHKEIMQCLQKMESNRQLYIAPRGFAKSSLCSRFYPLWLSIFKKKKDIFLVSATISIAKENLRIIRTELESNEKIIEDFGDLRSDKWTEEQLVLSTGPIIRAKGRGFQIRGFRPDLLVCDDLEDDESVNSQEQREKVENWFFRTLMPTLKPDQPLVYIGTKMHRLALIAKLEEKEEFVSRSYQALTNDVSIWEDYWPTEKLKALRKELGEYAFQAEYQNNPLSLAEQPIKPHFLDCKSDGEIVATCMAIDPAISEKESADYRAIQVMGMTREGHFREIVTDRGRWGIDEQVDRIIDMYQVYKPDRVLLEEVAFQKIMRPLIVNKARDKGIYIPIESAELGVGKNKRPKDKMTRLLQVIHLFEQQLVEIKNPDVRVELLDFPFGDHDDTVDVTVYNLYWLKDHAEGRFMYKKEVNSIVNTLGVRKSFYVEEVKPNVFVAKIGEPIMKPKVGNLLFNYDKN